MEMRGLCVESSESECVSAEIYCDCVGAEQEQEIHRDESVIRGEIGRRDGKRESRYQESWRRGGNGASTLVFNGG